MLTCAFSSWKCLIMVIAADSRVSPVSALNANPSTAILYANVLLVTETR
jgi:hypothetical protein